MSAHPEGTTMHTISEHHVDGGLTERRIAVGDTPGIVWMPDFPGSIEPLPVLLLGHPGDLGRMRPRLLDRARRAAASGFAAATIELPGSGRRPAWPELDAARRELRAAITAGAAVDEDVIDRLVLPLVARSAPEWRALLDDLADEPRIGGPAGFSGGNLSIGVRLAATEPRIRAVGLFAGSLVPRAIVDEARGVATPAHVLLQWDDVDNDRARSLELFDALGSSEKTLQANLGGHVGVPAWAAEDAARFFERRLRPAVSAAGS